MNKLLFIISLFVISCGGDNVVEELPQQDNTTICMFDMNYLNYVFEMKGVVGISDDRYEAHGIQFYLSASSPLDSKDPGTVLFNAFNNLIIPQTDIIKNNQQNIKLWTVLINIPEKTEQFFISVYSENCGHKSFNFLVE